MTRTQVARRLGRSLATVRRIEGVLLHPIQDARGVHRFDEDEVAALAEDVVSGRVELARAMRDTSDDDNTPAGCGRCKALEAQLVVARYDLTAAREQHLTELATLRRERDAERARFEAEAAELAREAADLVRTLEG